MHLAAWHHDVPVSEWSVWVCTSERVSRVASPVRVRGVRRSVSLASLASWVVLPRGWGACACEGGVSLVSTMVYPSGPQTSARRRAHCTASHVTPQTSHLTASTASRSRLTLVSRPSQPTPLQPALVWGRLRPGVARQRSAVLQSRLVVLRHARARPNRNHGAQAPRAENTPEAPTARTMCGVRYTHGKY